MSAATKILRGSGSNVIRLAFTSLAALALPPVLTRTLDPAEYSAWVTILQLSTYLGLLDLGLQTVVARFVAEHTARAEHRRAAGVVSSSVAILVVGAAVGVAALVAAALAIPALLPGAPARLHGQITVALLLVGGSAAIALPFGPYLSAFTGLQRYGFPVVVAITSKALSAAAVAAAALLGGDLVATAAALAVVNVIAALLQRTGYRRLVLPLLQRERGVADRATVRTLLGAGSVIALWSLGGVLVSGLDTVLVGHFDFRSAGAFAVAAAAVNFLLLFLNSLFSPLLPAAAAMQGADTARRLGALTVRATRYSTLMVLALGAVLCVFAYPLLAIWVGPEYAETGAPLLRLLVLGHALRQLGYVYSLVVIARGQQRPATVATMSEAVVNLLASVALAQVLGAAGVAIGTVAGAAVSLLLHLVVSMRYTRHAIPVRRRELGLGGVLLPALTALPLLLVLPGFQPRALVPAPAAVLALAFAAFTVAAAVLGLSRDDRSRIAAMVAGALPSGGDRRHAG